MIWGLFYSIISRSKNLLKGNRMRFKIFVLIITSLLLIVACDSKERVKAPEHNSEAAATAAAMGSAHTILIKEVMQGNTYTYLYAAEGDKEYWIATAKQPIEAGMTLHYDQGLEMQDFTSKEVDKTFDSIWFVGQLRGMSSAAMASGTKKVEKAKNVAVEKVAGGVTVQELYANKAKYEGEMVSIRGQVTKFNAAIMGRNWVHLQDGTTSGDAFDITITTSASVSKDDIVVFSGKVALNKDFGAGYKYEVIIEDATLSAES